MKESQLQSWALKYYAMTRDVLVIRVNSGGFKDRRDNFYRMLMMSFPNLKHNGHSDLVVYTRGGKAGFIELKADELKLDEKTGKLKRVKGKQTSTQKDFQEVIESLGFKYFLAWSQDEVIDAVNQIKEGV